MPKTSISAATTVGPTGVENIIEIMIPPPAHMTEMMAAVNVTARKLLQTLIADRAGNMTRAEMRSEPTRSIASTIITAITTAISKL